MPLPKWLGQYKSMIVTTRKFDPNVDDIDDLLIRDFQKEAMLQKEFQTDKGRARKANAVQIKRVREYIRIAKDNKSSAQEERLERLERLDKWLDGLYVERFGLFRDEYLCLVQKKSGGFLPESEMQKIPGSPQWVKQMQKQKNKREKNKPETN